LSYGEFRRLEPTRKNHKNATASAASNTARRVKTKKKARLPFESGLLTATPITLRR